MSTTSRTSTSLYSTESFSNEFKEMDDWLASLKNGQTPTTTNENFKLNAEIHLAITTEPLEFASSLCDHLFTLYRDVQNRPFVLQFLPSFVMAYYDVLYQHPPKSVDATTKDVCTTIDTFLVGLYNLSVLDNGRGEKVHAFRIPNLTLPSIYHTPNSDYYAPTPLTQHAVSKHEKKCELVRLQSFPPFDTVNATTREQILWFLLIQYGINVSLMDVYSRESYFQMANKLLGQGFSFNENPSAKTTDSVLPPTGRRIHLSSRIMSEILGTLFYFKANSKAKEAWEAMRLLKQRAEYELYADVILMTESMGYLHEFETQRPEKQDNIGIEIELPPTVDMVKQKRTATTARSMKNRHRSHKHHRETDIAIAENDLPNDTIEHLNFVPVPSGATSAALTPPTQHQRRSILDILNENSPTTESVHSTSANTSLSTEKTDESVISTNKSDVPSIIIADNNSSITPSIGSSIASPSPTLSRQYRPISLTSTQTYFKTIQQQRASSPNSQHVQTIIRYDADLPLSRASSMKHGGKKDSTATVRFVGTDENRTKAEETYL